MQTYPCSESVDRLAVCLCFEVEVAAAVGGDPMPLSQNVPDATALFCATLTFSILSHRSSIKQAVEWMLPSHYAKFEWDLVHLRTP